MKNLKRFLHWCWRLLVHSPCLLVQRSRIRLTHKVKSDVSGHSGYRWALSKVFEGGSFQPGSTCNSCADGEHDHVLRTGNSDASAYNAMTDLFHRHWLHWALGYIKYCQSLGIIAGKSSTKFCPNDKVTAQEAAKMLPGNSGLRCNQGRSGRCRLGCKDQRTG